MNPFLSGSLRFLNRTTVLVDLKSFSWSDRKIGQEVDRTDRGVSKGLF